MDTPLVMDFPYVMVSGHWPEFIVRFTDTVPVSVQGHRLMVLEQRLREVEGRAWEVYLETTDDGNRPRAEVMERVREWRQRRQEMKQSGVTELEREAPIIEEEVGHE